MVILASAHADAALALAERLDLPTVAEPPGDGLSLQWTDAGLALQAGARRPQRVIVDFIAGAQGHRATQLGHRRELVARACGLGAGRHPMIVDATAGLGRDAFVLAALGARVTLLERSAILAELLADGLARAAEAGQAATVERMTLVHTEARAWLADQANPPRPAVVYLDPMYAGARRKAAAGKSLAMLQTLLGPDDDADDLLHTALQAARERVVVKRQRKAPPLAGLTPDYAVSGRSTRFDVYRLSAGPPADAGEY